MLSDSYSIKWGQLKICYSRYVWTHSSVSEAEALTLPSLCYVLWATCLAQGTHIHTLETIHYFVTCCSTLLRISQGHSFSFLYHYKKRSCILSHLRFLFLHPEDPWCNLDGGQRLSVVPRGGWNVSYHRGAAVHIPQGLPKQHGELAVSAK